jgi:hypothetical protein
MLEQDPNDAGARQKAPARGYFRSVDLVNLSHIHTLRPRLAWSDVKARLRVQKWVKLCRRVYDMFPQTCATTFNAEVARPGSWDTDIRMCM